MPVEILLVDDDALLLRALQRDLSTSFVVQAAAGLQAALQIVEDQPPGRFALVLTDLNMPAGNEGLRLLAAVRERWPGCARVLMSGSDVTAIEEAVASGLAQAFVAKPCDRQELRAVLNRLLGRLSA